MLADELSRTQVFVAVIGAAALVMVAIVQNFRGFKQTRTATTAAAEEAANGVGARGREEMRSAVRALLVELSRIEAKIDDLADGERALEDDAIEKNGRRDEGSE